MLQSYEIKNINGSPIIITYTGSNERSELLDCSEKKKKEELIDQNVLELLKNKRKELQDLLSQSKQNVKEDLGWIGIPQFIVFSLGLFSIAEKRCLGILGVAGFVDFMISASVAPRFIYALKAYSKDRDNLKIVDFAIEMFEKIFSDQVAIEDKQIGEYSSGEQSLADKTNIAYYNRIQVAEEALAKSRGKY